MSNSQDQQSLKSMRGLKACVPVFAALILSACSGMQKQPEPAAVPDPAVVKQAEREALFERAFNAQIDGDLDSAKSLYKDLVSDKPSAAVYYNLANISLAEDDKALAFEQAEKALGLEPNHKQSANLLGVLSREQGKFEQAERYYRQALSADPSYHSAMLNLAMLLDLYQGRLAEALALYETLQEQGNENPKLKDWIFDLKRRVDQ